MPWAVVEHKEGGGFETPSWLPRRLSRYREWLLKHHPSATLRVQATSRPPHAEIDTLLQIRVVEHLGGASVEPILVEERLTSPEMPFIFTSARDPVNNNHPLLAALREAHKYLGTKSYPCKPLTGGHVTETFDIATGILLTQAKARLLLYGKRLPTKTIPRHGWIQLP